MPVSKPPVPAKLVEKLQQYPELIDRLQDVLNDVEAKPPSIIPRFERAVDALEGRLDSFMVEARGELERMRASADPGLVAAAESKFRLISQIGLKQFWIGDEALWQFFK